MVESIKGKVVLSDEDRKEIIDEIVSDFSSSVERLVFGVLTIVLCGFGMFSCIRAMEFVPNGSWVDVGLFFSLILNVGFLGIVLSEWLYGGSSDKHKA